MRHHRIGRQLLLASVAAAMLLLPTLGHAGFLSKGRTKAIRTQIASKINKMNLMHVGNRIRSQDIRIRTRAVKEQRIGAQQRSVKWHLKPRILAGTARSFTPVVPSGGRYTTIRNLKLTMAPRGGLLPRPALR